MNLKKEVNIGVVGKYTNLKDSYKSLIEALTHGGIENNVKVKIKWINAEKIQESKLLDETYLDSAIDFVEMNSVYNSPI